MKNETQRSQGFCHHKLVLQKIQPTYLAAIGDESSVAAVALPFQSLTTFAPMLPYSKER
ncbi:MAG: hypothetical protein AAGD09_25960 [Cyanobacteria bacterium P01_F01_bin.56]